jgi:hypothetical protein
MLPHTTRAQRTRNFNASRIIVDEYKRRKRVRLGREVRNANSGPMRPVRVTCFVFGELVCKHTIRINHRSPLTDLLVLVKRNANAIVQSNPNKFHRLQGTNIENVMIQKVRFGKTDYSDRKLWRRHIGVIAAETHSASILIRI